MRSLSFFIFLLSAPAFSAPKSMPTMLIANGTCQELVLGGKEHTGKCNGKLLNTSYADGRVGFYFTTSNGATLTFSGMGSQQVMPDSDTAIQPVDKVIFNFKGQTATDKAVGTCRYTNPYKGGGVVACKADTPNGFFSAAFQTDGQRPKIVNR